MPKEELALYKQAWEDAGQVEVLCNHEMVALADQRFELIVHEAKLDAFAAEVTIHREFEQQLAADAVDRQLRSIFEPALAKAQFHADKWFAECDEAKAQLQDALHKLKLSEAK